MSEIEEERGSNRSTIGDLGRRASFAPFRAGQGRLAGRRQTLVLPPQSVVQEHVRGRFFEEARPVKGATYFPRSTASTAVVICLYNEVGPEGMIASWPGGRGGRPHLCAMLTWRSVGTHVIRRSDRSSAVPSKRLRTPA